MGCTLGRFSGLLWPGNIANNIRRNQPLSLSDRRQRKKLSPAAPPRRSSKTTTIITTTIITTTSTPTILVGPENFDWEHEYDEAQKALRKKA